MKELLQRWSSTLPDWMISDAFQRLVTLVVVVIVVVLFVKLLQRATSRLVADGNARYRVRKAVGFAGYTIAALIVITAFSERFGQLSVILGVAGAGIAFALQEVIVSVAGWIAVSLGGYYKTGDRIQLGGIRGDVIDIGVLRTTLAEVGEWVHGDLYNGRVVRMANSFVFKDPVVNYSGDFQFLWDEMRVPIRHGSDVARMDELLLGIAREVCGDYAKEAETVWRQLAKRYPLEQASTQPMVSLSFDENWLTFTLRYVVRYDRRRVTRTTLSRAVLAAIDGEESVSLAAAAIELYPRAPFEVRNPT